MSERENEKCMQINCEAASWRKKRKEENEMDRRGKGNPFVVKAMRKHSQNSPFNISIFSIFSLCEAESDR